MRIYDLKVEHKTEPLGIDGNDPLFSFLCDEGGTFSVAVFDSDGNAVAEKAVAAPENGGLNGRSLSGAKRVLPVSKRSKNLTLRSLLRKIKRCFLRMFFAVSHLKNALFWRA